MVDQAVRTIQDKGVEALTLREAGARLGVSRTALYRHFADKQALLAAVATDGFRTFRQALQSARDDAGRGRVGFLAMGRAYIRFALDNPSHYRVMFGGYVGDDACHVELRAEGEAAFRVLVDAIVELQQARLARQNDPMDLALFVWASTHGAAMLLVSGQLARSPHSPDVVIERLVAHVWDAVAAPATA